MNGNMEIANNLDILRAWHEKGIAPERFDVVTDNAGEKTVETVYKVE